MKCSVCGSEFSPNSQNCPNCGTRVIEMSGMYGKHTEFGSNPDAIDLTYDGKKNMKKSHTGRKVVLTLVIILVLLAGSVGMFYYRNFTVKTYDINDISVSLPVSMEIDDDNTFSDMKLSDAFSTDAKSYKNTMSLFGYISIDFASSLSESDVEDISEETFITMYEASVSNQKGNGYKKYSLDGNVLKAAQNNKNGELMYEYMVCEKRGTKYYIFVFECRDKHKDLFEDKFEEWADTIKIN